MTPKRDELLSHEADGIREFNNALPRWWLYGFYFTIVFAVVYVANYHLLPQPIVGRPSLTAEYEADLVRAASLVPRSAPGASGPVAARTDQASLDKGRAIFEGEKNLCASCHRPDLGGLVGPNLTDEYWMHGCSVAELVGNVKTGFPTSGMLPLGTGQHLSDEELVQVVSYVLSKRGSNPDKPKGIDLAREQICK